MTAVATNRAHVVIIGAGFTGLSAALELIQRGYRVTVLECDDAPGGLAGGFDVDGVQLEKFYHHWFTSDKYVMDLVQELSVGDRVVYRPTATGMYFANQVFRLSKPLDVLRFAPLPLIDRLRLGALALRARRVRDWKPLESVTAADWLRRLGGSRVFRVVWEPLLRGKFGDRADDVSAVWFWNKLKLRGGSRGKHGEEMLAYFRGGFIALAEQLVEAIREAGGEVRLGTKATSIATEDGRVVAVETSDGIIDADALIMTPALPIVADLLEPHVSQDYAAQLRRIEYLANVCVVLELDRSLSDTYWLNVNDPGFPFVGVIEHTNFEPPASYGGKHIVYLSKYLPESAELFRMSDDAVFAFCVPYLKRIFPDFTTDWVQRVHVWRARYSQPLVVRNYSRLIPPTQTPVNGVYLATMAQVYPEDRGTNYAIRDGREVGRLVAAELMERSSVLV